MAEPSYLESIRVAYDTYAADYAAKFRDRVAELPIERGLLAAFAELVLAADVGPVADLGCGPGHFTAYLKTLGLNIFGIDLSPEMVANARREHPEVRFEEGTMTALDLPGHSLGGITALFSIVHIPEADLPAVFGEFRRVLAPGGHILIAFQIGDEAGTKTQAFGRPIVLDYYLRPADRVAGLMEQAGLKVIATLVREPDGIVEQAARAYLLATA
jgi:ubiquinone/menaquinone biosynthesis C-methylase UbiE